jgi:hypothetical protein
MRALIDSAPLDVESRRDARCSEHASAALPQPIALNTLDASATAAADLPVAAQPRTSSLRWSEFRNALDGLVLTGNVPAEIHPKHVSELEKQFVRWRETAKTKLANKLAQLKDADPENPAFLSVSLLRLLDGTGLRETAHTRMLAWMFNPARCKDGKGAGHGLPPDLFLTVLDWAKPKLKQKWPHGDYAIKRVQAEKSIANDQRVDIWIEGTVRNTGGNDLEWLAVIEAKVEGARREEQLDAYEQEGGRWVAAAADRLPPCLIFLTKPGYGDLSEDWLSLTYLDLFKLLWLRISALSDKNHIDGYQLVRYYLAGILCDLHGWQLPLELSEGNVDYQMIEFADFLAAAANEKGSP